MSRPFTALVIPDTHFPFQDDKAVEAALDIAKDLQPHAIVHLGDLVDCWQISDYDRDPSRVDDLRDNIQQARDFLADVHKVAPKAELTLLEGNHEDRLRRAIWRATGPMREVVKLPEFKTAVSWPKLFKLEQLGWSRFVPIAQQSHANVLPKIITKHGTAVRKWSSYTAKEEQLKYGMSGVSGHTHRLGAFYHRDYNGRSVWIECGCICSLNPAMEYCDDPDWQQGVVVLRWSGDRKVLGEQIVGIRDGNWVL